MESKENDRDKQNSSIIKCCLVQLTFIAKVGNTNTLPINHFTRLKAGLGYSSSTVFEICHLFCYYNDWYKNIKFSSSSSHPVFCYSCTFAVFRNVMESGAETDVITKLLTSVI